MKSCRIIVAICLLLLASRIEKLYAQNNLPVFSEFPNQRLLEDRIILNVLKDSKGFLWIGCTDGTSRYDGYELETFNASLGDSLKLQNNYDFSLFEDSEGRIWIGGHDYISVFDYDPENFTSFWIPRNETATISERN